MTKRICLLKAILYILDDKAGAAQIVGEGKRCHCQSVIVCLHHHATNAHWICCHKGERINYLLLLLFL